MLSKDPYNQMRGIKCPVCQSTDYRLVAKYDFWRCRKYGHWFDIVLVDGHHEAKELSPPITPRQLRGPTPTP